MPDRSLIETVFNASLALAGILLVFVGFIYTRVQAFPPGTDRAIVGQFTIVAKLGVLPFVVAIVLAGLTFYDLTSPGMPFWRVIKPLFWFELLLLFLYGAVSVLRYLG